MVSISWQFEINVIKIFFVPGMFGSLIESVLRRSLDPTAFFKIADDGSMHTFKKYAHPVEFDKINEIIQQSNGNIITPIYPMPDADLDKILVRVGQNQPNKHILIYAGSEQDAEINMLFQYHKIAVGLNFGLKIFCGNNSHNIANWNNGYTHWSQMQTWELREWLSLFYVEWTQKWINSQYQVGDDFLKIKNTDLLSNPLDQLRKIINFCELTEFDQIESFLQDWKNAQQYIVNEFKLIDDIVAATIHNLPLTWNNLNIIAEAIIQQRLRTLKYEIRCDNLNTFPTDSKTLYKLLEKV